MKQIDVHRYLAARRANGHLWRPAVWVVAVSTLLGMLPSVIWTSSSVVSNLILSYCIGFSTWGTLFLVQRSTRWRLPMPWAQLIAAPVGAVLGFAIGGAIGAGDTVALILRDPTKNWQFLAVNLLLVVLASTYFVMLYRSERLRADLEVERRLASESRQQETAAKLALLRSQIEPHFLFNTLSNIQSTIETEPRVARVMLDCLNRYLRTSLGKTREPAFSLGDEIELIDATLIIAGLRMRDRLAYEIDVPSDLRSILVPPLMLQPLVENALRHGIEPSITGGTVKVAIRRDEDGLRVRVTDTGVGLRGTIHEGVGLATLRQRLATLYDSRGKLSISSHHPSGTVAEVVLPLREVR